ncbi:MAG TPA: hypothetical protein VJ746_11825 [Nitrospira sp.]|nr:hypothetical protein [Nitrospira sp.]
MFVDIPLTNPSVAAWSDVIPLHAINKGTSAIHVSHPMSGLGSEHVSNPADSNARGLLNRKWLSIPCPAGTRNVSETPCTQEGICGKDGVIISVPGAPNGARSCTMSDRSSQKGSAVAQNMGSV